MFYIVLIALLICLAFNFLVSKENLLAISVFIKNFQVQSKIISASTDIQVGKQR